MTKIVLSNLFWSGLVYDTNIKTYFKKTKFFSKEFGISMPLLFNKTAPVKTGLACMVCYLHLPKYYL